MVLAPNTSVGATAWENVLETYQYPMVPEDEVDMESLQAQIDMSMSFAQNLVTSWIKPTHLAQLGSSGANTAQMLEEESRRPPRYPTMLCVLWTYKQNLCRLGVGASIPTAPPLAHEASKLKRRLGRNGVKNEDVVQSQLQDSSKSDDEEHKGRPAKRKTKVDPFRREGSKKRRIADSEANRYPSAENVYNHSVSLLNKSTLGEPKKYSKGYSFCLSYSIVTSPCQSHPPRKENSGWGRAISSPM